MSVSGLSSQHLPELGEMCGSVSYGLLQPGPSEKLSGISQTQERRSDKSPKVDDTERTLKGVTMCVIGTLISGIYPWGSLCH